MNAPSVRREPFGRLRDGTEIELTWNTESRGPLIDCAFVAMNVLVASGALAEV